MPKGIKKSICTTNIRVKFERTSDMKEKNEKIEGFEFVIKESDVIDRENFGSFEVVMTRQGAIFKNYTGFKVFTTPYSVGLDGVAHETSLYEWLKYIIDFKRSIAGKENEMFEGTECTNQDMLDGMKIVTEANMVKPQVVFTDFEEAQREAEHYIAWIGSMMKELDNASNAVPPEEDMKANAEFEHKIEMTGLAKEVLDGTVQTEERQV